MAYNRFRYYDPEDGRYISVDPIGLESGEFGFYNYVEDSNSLLDIYGLASSYAKHHIATNKHKDWAPKFEKLFKKYGLDKFKNGNTRKHPLNNPHNIVKVKGHKGPHSEKNFHKNIHKRLSDAGKKGGAEGFKAELAKMKVESVTEGSNMNKIITKTY